jgi:hypothetical protein
LDPTDFVGRYLSYAQPCAANLGPEGALLCHVLYAWATSYGVDEHGQLDVPEGGGEPMGNISLLDPGKDEVKREADRQARFAKMRIAVDIILREIEANVGWSTGLATSSASDRRYAHLLTLATQADKQESLHQSSD